MRRCYKKKVLVRVQVVEVLSAARPSISFRAHTEQYLTPFGRWLSDLLGQCRRYKQLQGLLCHPQFINQFSNQCLYINILECQFG